MNWRAFIGLSVLLVCVVGVPAIAFTMTALRISGIHGSGMLVFMIAGSVVAAAGLVAASLAWNA